MKYRIFYHTHILPWSQIVSEEETGMMGNFFTLSLFFCIYKKKTDLNRETIDAYVSTGIYHSVLDMYGISYIPTSASLYLLASSYSSAYLWNGPSPGPFGPNLDQNFCLKVKFECCFIYCSHTYFSREKKSKLLVFVQYFLAGFSQQQGTYFDILSKTFKISNFSFELIQSSCDKKTPHFIITAEQAAFPMKHCRPCGQRPSMRQ